MSSYNQEFTEQDQAILDHVFEENKKRVFSTGNKWQ